MSPEPPEIGCEDFPRTWFYPKWRLVCWCPRGVLNEALIDKFIKCLEIEERNQDAPFDRYVDLSGLTKIRIGVVYIVQAARRRAAVKQPAKYAFFADKRLSFSVAQMYETLMSKAMIEVRTFRERAPAAEWLEVPMEILEPPF